MPNSQCTTCEKVFEKLDTDTEYSVSVRGYNKNGLGQMSNILMFKPIVTPSCLLKVLKM